MDPRSRRSKTATVTAAKTVVVTAMLMAPALARADQFTMFDFTYEARRDNTHDAHYDVRAPMYTLTQPDNWTSPIDYTKGTVYIEQDVLTKPSEEETQVDICFLTARGYGCRNTEHYFKTGRVTTIRAVTRFNDFASIDWTKRIPLVQLIVKDKDNRNGGVPPEKFMPTKMRIAMTFVSAGGTYTVPAGFAPNPNLDGGAGPAADAGEAGSDASAAVDAAPAAKDSGAAVAADAAPVVRVDAGNVDPPPPVTGPAPDASAPPPRRMDAGVAPPPDPDPPPPRASGAGSCAVGGGGRSGAFLLLGWAVVAAVALARVGRRRRR
jgi:hypothetical protein